MSSLMRSLMLSTLVCIVSTVQICADSTAKHQVQTRGCCCNQGPAGPQGAQGAQGEPGTAGSFVLGYAEFVNLGNEGNSDLSEGDALTFDTPPVQNSLGIASRAANNGTTFTFPAGTYVLDYETSANGGGIIGIFTGPVGGSLTLLENSLAGVTNTVMWIHGRIAIQLESSQDVIVGVAEGDEDFNVARMVTNSVPIVRLTVIRLA